MVSCTFANDGRHDIIGALVFSHVPAVGPSDRCIRKVNS